MKALLASLSTTPPDSDKVPQLLKLSNNVARHGAWYAARQLIADSSRA